LLNTGTLPTEICRLLQQTSPTLRDFALHCLTLDRIRPTAKELLEHPFLQLAARGSEEFAHNMKFYLADRKIEKALEERDELWNRLQPAFVHT
jgi:hypothetical protein